MAKQPQVKKKLGVKDNPRKVFHHLPTRGGPLVRINTVQPYDKTIGFDGTANHYELVEPFNETPYYKWVAE